MVVNTKTNKKVRKSGQGNLEYPWEVWLKRRVIRLKHGVHYDCMEHSMAQQLRNAARVYGYKVKISITPSGLVAIPTKLRKVR